MALGQPTSPPRPEFEVQSVKLNKSGAAGHQSDVSKSGQVHFVNVTIAELLPMVFQRKEDLIVGVPEWLKSDHYDITAKASPGVSEATLGLMLQSLLAREFRLTFHEEQRPVDAFALVVSKRGAKVVEVPADTNHPYCGRGDGIEQSLDCSGVSIANLIPTLLFQAKDYIDRPIVDQTGMTGNYQMKLMWTPQRLIESNGGLTVFDALTKQLGLRLEQRKLAASVIVIDYADRLSEN